MNTPGAFDGMQGIQFAFHILGVFPDDQKDDPLILDARDVDIPPEKLIHDAVDGGMIIPFDVPACHNHVTFS
ncbi:MAG: hypothetical protein MZV70_01090 [Desulfobacterales bacterium]|nr:hypothetical protein [Desulfobacterales bacterium]